MTTETSRPAARAPAAAQPRLSPSVTVAASVIGLLLLAALGWVAWSGAVLGLRGIDFDSPLTLALTTR